MYTHTDCTLGDYKLWAALWVSLCESRVPGVYRCGQWHDDQRFQREGDLCQLSDSFLWTITNRLCQDGEEHIKAVSLPRVARLPELPHSVNSPGRGDARHRGEPMVMDMLTSVTLIHSAWLERDMVSGLENVKLIYSWVTQSWILVEKSQVLL